MTKVKLQVGDGADTRWCPPAAGTGQGHARLALPFPGRLGIPSQNAGGNVVIPGVTFSVSVTVSIGARGQLSVTARGPGVRDAGQGLQSSLSFISCAEKRSLIRNRVPLDLNSCGL